jgi:hypothetical protein
MRLERNGNNVSANANFSGGDDRNPETKTPEGRTTILSSGIFITTLTLRSPSGMSRVQSQSPG